MSGTGQLKRIEAILLAAGIESRQDLKAKYDKDKGYIGLSGIGPVRATIIKHYMAASFEEWIEAFPNLPIYDPSLTPDIQDRISEWVG